MELSGYWSKNRLSGWGRIVYPVGIVYEGIISED
jgi:hypothetical protein